MKTDNEILSRLGIQHLPSPDFERMRRVLNRDGIPDRVPLFELAIDDEVFAYILGEPVGHTGGYAQTEKGQRVSHWATKEEGEHYVRQVIRVYYHLGYDFVILPMHIPFVRPFTMTEDTAGLQRSVGRGWVDQHASLISNWQDFERYDWDRLANFDFSILEYAASILPEGMGLLTRTQGVMDGLMRLMGFDSLFYTLSDDPPLVEAIVERVGNLLERLFGQLVQLDGLRAVSYADDMGFKTGTLISPSHTRKFLLTWMKKYVNITHERGLPFILHSCGNIERLMNEIIDDIGIDAKHSFEDVILPISEAKRKYGDRIAILGGMDMNLLASSTEEQVRAAVRQAILDCAPNGGFALSSGNSIANYIPMRNYLAMLDEAMKVGVYA
jgi:uroporphyrinogen decarboxylase